MYYSRRREPWYTKGSAWLAIIGVIVVGMIAVSCGSAYYKETSVTLTVTGKESVNTQDGHEYRIYSDDEVYVMTDSIVKGRFRTANDYARIKEGQTYTCTTWGLRVPFFSKFKNLKDCTPAK